MPRTLRGVATNPLVVMTIAGLVAGQIFPAGLPPTLAALVKQVALFTLSAFEGDLGHTKGALR